MYEDRYETGNRSGWEFEYLGGSLVATTETRLKYHHEREKYWRTEAKSVEDQIREKGVQLQERSVTGGVRFEAKVDQRLGDLLGELRGKADDHRTLAEQFEGFSHEFQRTPDRAFKLKLADLKFFGLVGETTVFGDDVLS